MDKKRYTLEDFQNIIAELRSDHGCPWDRVQTHDSLRPCVTEEATELLAAIRIYEKTGNPENMQEELGDLLMQVVLHSEIAKEEGLFTMDDVIAGISEKMIRRHPHVFGDMDPNDREAISRNWDTIKQQEKEKQSWVESPLREIPEEHPALVRATKVLKKIDKLYEPREGFEACVNRLGENVRILQECARPESPDRERILSEQLGKILIDIADIARVEKLPCEQILKDETEKLIELYEEGTEK